MRRPIALLLLAAAASLSPNAAADGPAPAPPPPADGQPADSRDASTPEYLKAVDLQRKKKWKEAQAAFRAILAKYPTSVHAHDCEMRGGDNCYMGVERLHDSGPPARRIDVAVMGDGFQIDDKQQQDEQKWAALARDVLWTEHAYSEYRNYFNFYFVRLVSKDEGVDEVISDEELRKRQESAGKKKKKFKEPKAFNTAIDCKAAGPQRQVMADHELVYGTWLPYANADMPGCGDDGLVIAFAKFGQLGMAELGNGLANCGRPDQSVTVHEFGHAFAGLYDEYANQPGPPTMPIRAPNATSDRASVPWQHFIDKKWKGLPPGGVEGGATYKSGVWRPGPPCAMNSAGGSGYCPPCREASILRIYGTVSPIDKINRDPYIEVKCTEGDNSELVVTPMQPFTHELKCEWYIDRLMDSDPAPVRPDTGETFDGTPKSRNGSRGTDGRTQGRDPDYYKDPPLGALSELSKIVRGKGEPVKFVLPTGKLPRGRWQVTCRVWDDCGEHVVKDDLKLLEEREYWFVKVAPKK